MDTLQNRIFVARKAASARWPSSFVHEGAWRSRDDMMIAVAAPGQQGRSDHHPL
jgi:hypothetical protein